MVYWPVLSKQELQARQEQLAKEEKERAALDGITTDKVICGEQQPESDHFIRMENSRTGDDEGVHWRETTGWFSYRMKTNGNLSIRSVSCSVLRFVRMQSMDKRAGSR